MLKLEWWKESYLRSKQIDINKVVIDDRVKKVVAQLVSENNFVVIESSVLDDLNKLSTGVLVEWVNFTELGFEILSSITTQDQETLTNYLDATLLLVKVDSEWYKSSYKKDIADSFIIKRFSTGRPTLIEYFLMHNNTTNLVSFLPKILIKRNKKGKIFRVKGNNPTIYK